MAFHDRGSGRLPDVSDRGPPLHKREKPFATRYESYNNHLMTLYKNETGKTFLAAAPWIVWHEGKKFFWNLLFDRTVLGGLREIWNNRQALRGHKRWMKQQIAAGHGPDTARV